MGLFYKTPMILVTPTTSCKGEPCGAGSTTKTIAPTGSNKTQSTSFTSTETQATDKAALITLAALIIHSEHYQTTQLEELIKVD